MELYVVFKGFQRVVNDGAVSGAVDELPHAAGDGAGAPNYVRKLLAGFRTGFVDRAFIAVEEDAAGLFVALQDWPFFGIVHHIIGLNARRFEVEMFGEPLDRSEE